ncbi:MAG: pentapeptide repeat-containing protein [gamma proteobacterium endosymbiont of Lamellibrachia anaximandri]|nr:pentapeptide repeat-containing protein [gamma proteobacterium endosymbiont of Lamellibrachia anaximandri]MBL3533209.1 pentapeptide repeat-containing protein [gamma proteobacterium endosymbiont of Lamellibrachia anaximandri]
MKHVANPFLISFSVLLLCSPQLVSAGFFENLSNSVTSGLEKAGEFIEDNLPPVEQESPNQEGTDSISGKSALENQHTAQPSETVEPIKEQRASEKRASLSRSEIKEIQERLNQMGYNTGTPDGLPGKKTKKAIAAYQADNDWHIDGVPSYVVLKSLQEQQSIGKGTALKKPNISSVGLSHRSEMVGGSGAAGSSRGASKDLAYFRVAAGAKNTFVITSDGALLGWGRRLPGRRLTIFSDEIKLSSIVRLKNVTGKARVRYLGLEQSGTVVNISPNQGNGNKTYGVQRLLKKKTALKEYPINGIVAISRNAHVMKQGGKLYSEVGLDGVVDYFLLRKRGYAVKKDGSVWVRQIKSLGQSASIGLDLRKFEWAPKSKWRREFEFPSMKYLSGKYIGREGYKGVGISNKGQLIAWTSGSNQNKKADIKYLLNNVIHYSSGGSHHLALRSDGTVWAWGKNNKVQLGDGTDVDRNSPVKVKGIGNAVSIAAGSDHSVALTSEGSVWAWGMNDNNQLGNGTGKASPVPVRVKGWGGTGHLNLQDFNPATAKVKMRVKAENAKAKAEKEKIDTECKKLASLVANRNPSRSRDFSNMNFSVCVSKHGLDLRGADLSGASLGGAQLDRMDLSKADLSDSNLNNASLVGSNLRGADLSSAKFRNANLSRADLSNSVAKKTMFQKAILVDAKLRNADLSAAYFSRADVSGADFTGARITDRRRLFKAKNIEEAIGIRGDTHSSGYTQQSASSSSLPQDNSSLAQQFRDHLGGKRIDYKYNAPGQGPSMDITAFACKNGEFILKNNSAMSGGSGVNIGGGPSIRSGRWSIFTQGGKGFLIVNYADGQQETYELLVQNGTTYFNGDQVNVSDKNTFCP